MPRPSDEPALMDTPAPLDAPVTASDPASTPVPAVLAEPHWGIVIAAGLAAGMIAGLLGVGGGILLVPVLALVLRRPQHVAHATSLVAVTMAALAGSARFAVDGAVAWPGAAVLAVGAILGAWLGAALLPRMSESGLRRAFGGVVLLLALRFLVFGGSGGEGATDGLFRPDLDPGLVLLHLGGGLAAGVLSSVLGVGGGIIMVPLMALAFGYGQQVAEGTSLAVIVPTAATGALSHARSGYTDWRLGLRLGAAALLGSFSGATLALGLTATALARVYGGVQVIVAALMLRSRRS